MTGRLGRAKDATPPFRTSLRGAAVALVAALATLLLAAGPASAHTSLESSDPADGASLATAPSRVALTFTEAPDANLATITVVGPDGRHYEQGTATVADRVMSIGVAPLGPAGVYQIGYRALSDDGHPVTGRVAFTLAAAGPAAAAAPAAPSAPSPSPVAAGQDLGAQDHSGHGGGSSGVPAWPFLLVGVVVVVGAGAYAARRRSTNG